MELEILQILNEITVSYLEKMFHIKVGADDKSPYSICEKPNFITEVYAYIGLAGEQHQGQIVMGFSHDFPEKLTEKFFDNINPEDKDEFSKSAICEMLNNIGGILSRHPQIRNTYMELSQTLPVLNDTTSQGSVYFMKSDGGSIKFHCLDEDIFMYLSIKRFMSTQVKTDDTEFSHAP